MSTLTGKLVVTRNDTQTTIKITSFSSGDMAIKLAGFTDLDWRITVEQVAIDVDYDGDTFDPIHVDSPEDATAFVKGNYLIANEKVGHCIAVKITDILGESLLLTYERLVHRLKNTS